jgi:hypothetical protein
MDLEVLHIRTKAILWAHEKPENMAHVKRESRRRKARGEWISQAYSRALWVAYKRRK